MSTLPQSAVEADILALSQEKFRWKTTDRIDLVEDLFDDDLVFIHLNGHFSTKKEWIRELRSKHFVYNSIELKEAAAKAYGDTVVLVGRATFKVTMGGSKGTYNLVYTEVYTKKHGKWKLVNLHTTMG
jgi:hypothetical protein